MSSVLPIALAGTNHKTSPLWLREKAALSGVGLFDTRQRLVGTPGLSELVVVSTCNRVEFYAAGPSAGEARERLRGFVQAEYCGAEEEVDSYFYFAEGREAVRHLLSVAVGADSMVLGECQVAGQVERSFEQARQEGTLGPELTRLARAAAEVVERIQAETAFGKEPVTIGSVAVAMARDQLGSLKNRAAMVLGAGDMGILTARALSANGIGAILVTNRTLSRAQEVAHTLGGKAVDYTELAAQIEKVDVLVTSTSAPHVLIKKAMLERIMAGRPQRPLFIIDLAVPRNVDPEAGDLNRVTLINVDDLEDAAARHSQERRAELAKVEAIIAQETDRFCAAAAGPRLSLLDLALG